MFCVLGQDIKFQNAQAQKRVTAKNDTILPSVKREKGVSTNLSVKENTSISLQTAVVCLTNINNSKSVKVRVLFDSGSHKSYVTQMIVDCLELHQKALMFQYLDSRIQFQKLLIYFRFVRQVFQGIKNIVRKFLLTHMLYR